MEHETSAYVGSKSGLRLPLKLLKNLYIGNFLEQLLKAEMTGAIVVIEICKNTAHFR
jgi:hypothetical protein